MKQIVFALSFLFTGIHAQSQNYFQHAIGTFGADAGRSIIKTSDGGYAIAGTSNMAVPNGEAYIVKTDSNGVIQWANKFNSSGFEMLQGIVQTFDGGYAVTGRSGYWEFKVLVMKLD